MSNISVVATLALLKILAVQSSYIGSTIQTSTPSTIENRYMVQDSTFPYSLNSTDVVEDDKLQQPTDEQEFTPFIIQVLDIIQAGDSNDRLSQKYLIQRLECDLAKITRRIHTTEEQLKIKLATCYTNAKRALQITHIDPRTFGFDIIMGILKNLLHLPEMLLCSLINCGVEKETSQNTGKPPISNRSLGMDDERNLYYCDFDDTADVYLVDTGTDNCDVSPWFQQLTNLYSFFDL